MISKQIASNAIGSITDPWGGRYPSTRGEGLIILFNNLLKTAVAFAGLFVLVNLILAGYGFMVAGGNSEKITSAWNKIWQSLLGLVIVLGSFILAAVIGYIVYGDPTAIITPAIYGPEQ